MRNIFSGLILGLIICLCGCDEEAPPPTLPPTTSGGGFILQTEFQAFGADAPVPAPGVQLSGSWQPPDQPGAQGNAASWSGVSSIQPVGLLALTNARAPAIWSITWVLGADPTCTNAKQNPFTAHVLLHGIGTIVCEELLTDDSVSVNATAFSIAPSTINVYTAPPTMQARGVGFSAAYGMPSALYFDMTGTLQGSETANSVASDGSSVTMTTPDLSGLDAGTYVGLFANSGPNGSSTVIGAAGLTLTTNCPLKPPNYCN